MIELGTEAPDFRLPDTDGNLVSLADFESNKGLLVIFMCNHCPYVKHIRHALANFARQNTSLGIGIVGINSNDVATYPADSPEKMREEVESAGYCFPYLFDESQDVAKRYLSIGVSSTTAVLETTSRLPGRTCRLRSTRCYVKRRRSRIRSQASGAT
jgi:peroxiredoxin